LAGCLRVDVVGQHLEAMLSQVGCRRGVQCCFSHADHVAATVEPAVESAFFGALACACDITAQDDVEVRPVGVLVELPHELGWHAVKSLQDQR